MIEEQSQPEKQSHQPITSSTNGEGMPVGEAILDFLSVLARRRRLFVWIVLPVTILAGLTAALSPKWYKGTAVVFPADQASLFPGLEGLSTLARSLGGGRLASVTGRGETDRYLAILKSETALMRVIERFNLTQVYEITRYPREKTMKELLANTEFELSDEGGLMITVYDKDPQRSADMANYFVDVLNETNSRMQAQNATANRTFIEQRVEKAKTDLREAEEGFKKYQESSGMLIMPDPGSSGVSAIAELYLMKAKKEVELGILERTVSQDNPILSQIKLELSEINKKVNQIPEVGIGSLRLYRNVVIQQKIMEFLIPLYEQAKVEEKRATPSVIVLDRAEVPERKARPKILLYTLLGGVVSSLFALFLVFLLEGIDRLRTMQPERFGQIMALVRSDWFGLRLRRQRK